MQLLMFLLAGTLAHATSMAVPTPEPTAVPSIPSVEPQIREGLRSWRNWIRVEDGTCGLYWRAKTPQGSARMGTQECRFKNNRGLTLWHPFGQDTVSAGQYVDRQSVTLIASFFQDENGVLTMGRTAVLRDVVFDESNVIRSYQFVLLDDREQPVFTRTFTQ